MKGFLIFIALFVGGFLVLLTQYEAIGTSIYEKVLEDEGGEAGKAAFEKFRQEKPQEFVQRYRENVNKRVSLCKYADLLNVKKLYLRMVEDTRDRYLEAFSGDEGMAQLADTYAYNLNDRSDARSYDVYKDMIERYPNYAKRDEILTKIKLLKIHYNKAD